MKTNPLVSILVISYNQEEYILECLNSIKNQTYKNFEIIISDDGSIDATQKLILNFYKQNIDNIEIKLNLSKENEGISVNSNHALNLASGKYVSWCGGDDIFHKEKIAEVVKEFDLNENISIVYHDMKILESNQFSDTKFSDLNKPMEGKSDALIKYGCFNCGSATSHINIPTKKLKFREEIPFASDWLYWIQILEHSGGSIKFLNQGLGTYRRHGSNITRKKEKFLNLTALDELNTINFLFYLYPNKKKLIHFRLSKIHYYYRHELGYSKSLLISLLYNFNYRSLSMLLVYISSLGLIKK